MRKNANSFVPRGARKLVLGVLATGAFLVAYMPLDSSQQAAAAPAAKAQVCHIPPRNPDNFHTITIPQDKVKKHAGVLVDGVRIGGHGDLEGPCSAFCATLCDDGNQCTKDDTADCEVFGCPTDRNCDAGYECPAGQTCDNPGCVSCDDEDQCTADNCSPLEGCVYPIAVDASCDDEALCTENDACGADGICVGTSKINCCESHDDCNREFCNGNFCDFEIDECDSTGSPCNFDAIDCTDEVCINETQNEGPCTTDTCCKDVVPEVPVLACDDGVDCTVDSCDPVNGDLPSGCLNTANDSACDELHECIADSCDPLRGDPVTGCQSTANDASCNGGNVCTASMCTEAGCEYPAIPGCCDEDSDCPTDFCDLSTNTCEAVPCFTMRDAANSGGSVLDCIDQCTPFCGASVCGQKLAISSTVELCIAGDLSTCDAIDDSARPFCSAICPKPPEPGVCPPPPAEPTSCPCWDGGLESVPGVTSLPDLWAQLGPDNCDNPAANAPDRCRDVRLSNCTTSTTAQCSPGSGGLFKTEVRDDTGNPGGVSGPRCFVNGGALLPRTGGVDPATPRQGISSVALQVSELTPEEYEACLQEHDEFTVGVSLPAPPGGLDILEGCGLAQEPRGPDVLLCAAGSACGRYHTGLGDLASPAERAPFAEYADFNFAQAIGADGFLWASTGGNRFDNWTSVWLYDPGGATAPIKRGLESCEAFGAATGGSCEDSALNTGNEWYFGAWRGSRVTATHVSGGIYSQGRNGDIGFWNGPRSRIVRLGAAGTWSEVLPKPGVGDCAGSERSAQIEAVPEDPSDPNKEELVAMMFYPRSGSTNEYWMTKTDVQTQTCTTLALLNGGNTVPVLSHDAITGVLCGPCGLERIRVAVDGTIFFLIRPVGDTGDDGIWRMADTDGDGEIDGDDTIVKIIDWEFTGNEIFDFAIGPHDGNLYVLVGGRPPTIDRLTIYEPNIALGDPPLGTVFTLPTTATTIQFFPLE